jgi:hypothetical protein
MLEFSKGKQPPVNPLRAATASQGCRAKIPCVGSRRRYFEDSEPGGIGGSIVSASFSIDVFDAVMTDLK